MSKRAFSIRRLLGLGLRFVVPFLVVSVIARLLIPANPAYPWHPTLSAKADHLQTTDEHYDVVLVGDSRAFRGIDPVLLNSELDRLGCPASTYNLGTVAQSKMEFDYVMDVIADIPAGTPEIVVVVDSLPLLAGFLKDFSVRQRVHMTASSAEEYLRYKANLPAEDFGTDPIEVADTAVGFALNQLPVGALQQQLFEQAFAEDEAALVSTNLGYQPWEEFYAEAGEDGVANLFATLEPELNNGGWDRRWTDEDPTPERVGKWVDTVAAHVDAVPESATAVQIFIPSYYDAGTLDAVVDGWQAAGRSEPIVNLVDVDLIGDYRDPSFFIDYWHLSERGSTAVTIAAAEALCPIVSERLGG